MLRSLRCLKSSWTDIVAQVYASKLFERTTNKGNRARQS